VQHLNDARDALGEDGVDAQPAIEGVDEQRADLLAGHLQQVQVRLHQHLLGLVVVRDGGRAAASSEWALEYGRSEGGGWCGGRHGWVREGRGEGGLVWRGRVSE